MTNRAKWLSSKTFTMRMTRIARALINVGIRIASTTPPPTSSKSEPSSSLKLTRNMTVKTEKLAAMVLICCLCTALLFLSSPAMCQEVEDESEFNYDEKSEKGPSRWGDIHPEWSLCKNGSMQSPIDLLNERVEIVSHLGTLQMNYQPSNATIKNRGHDIKLEWVTGAGYLQINETP
ncbi:Alpha carbonic anhydrase 7 [Spatholobus suberectus]|nr:Alpha carbonic anhydrase 7 [Spatholobus suberectus]